MVWYGMLRAFYRPEPHSAPPGSVHLASVKGPRTVPPGDGILPISDVSDHPKTPMNYWSDGPCAHFVEFRDSDHQMRSLIITFPRYPDFHNFRVSRSRKTFNVALGKCVFRPEGAPRDRPNGPMSRNTQKTNVLDPLSSTFLR